MSVQCVRALVTGSILAWLSAAAATGACKPDVLNFRQPQPPSAPTGFGATAISSSQINLTWTDRSTNETGFSIERALNEPVNFTVVATVSANVTQYADTGLTGATTYVYRMQAYNADGASRYTTVKEATTPAAVQRAH